MNRRESVKTAATAVAALSALPNYVQGAVPGPKPPKKLNIACVGVGGMGAINLSAVCMPLSKRTDENWPNADSQNIVALCDVDWNNAKKSFKEYPDAKRYKDYRVMLKEMDDEIDAVMVATADHTHACIAMEAMRRGKHVYVQKPLARTVHEVRVMTEAARKYGVITQMGNQGHSGEGIRLICEWIADGAIGDVREVHAWTSRPVWPQAVARPQDTPPIPETLDWDLWLGPSPDRPYHPVYQPFNWRGWVDFGTGALGDMACHTLDPIFWALKLMYPNSVEASCTKIHGKEFSESYPLSSIIHYEFPAREGMPEVKVHWYDGGLQPERPAELEEGRRMGGEGALFVGDKGKLICGTYGSSPQLIPYTKMQAYKRPEPTIPRVKGSHEMDWVNAIKEGRQPSSNFNYSGPLSEMVLMGTLAQLSPGKKLQWDGKNMQVTNVPELNKYVNPPCREGWHL